MQRAVEGLRLLPHLVLVDGNRLPVLKMPAAAIVKGDAKVQAISAASILAKVHRDRWCEALHADYPAYGFDGHKGYPRPSTWRRLRRTGAVPGAPPQLCAGAGGDRAGVPTGHDRAAGHHSRDNPLLQRLRRWRKTGRLPQGGQLWLEGDHLCSAAAARPRPAQAVISERPGASRRCGAGRWAPRVLRVPDALFDGLSALPSPAASATC
jgi:hypothetical protein